MEEINTEESQPSKTGGIRGRPDVIPSRVNQSVPPSNGQTPTTNPLQTGDKIWDTNVINKNLNEIFQLERQQTHPFEANPNTVPPQNLEWLQEHGLYPPQ